MGAIRRSRTAVAILVLFLVVGLAYMALAEVLGYRIEWGGRSIAYLSDHQQPVDGSLTMSDGARELAAGVDLLINIVAMLIVLVALVYLANAGLGLLPHLGGEAISLQRLLGYVMAPVCWLLGLPWDQAVTAGSLMGIKTVLNELIAYVELAKLSPDALDPRSKLIMLYAMCGFANFGSLGIMLGGLATMAPERREEIAALGPRSIVSGTLTTCLMGAVVGVMT